MLHFFFSFSQENFSPILIEEELSSARSLSSSPDVAIRVSSDACVVASYSLDDSELSLWLQIPKCLPLSSVTMVNSELTGVSPSLYEGWRAGVCIVNGSRFFFFTTKLLLFFFLGEKSAHDYYFVCMVNSELTGVSPSLYEGWRAGVCITIILITNLKPIKLKFV